MESALPLVSPEPERLVIDPQASKIPRAGRARVWDVRILPRLPVI